MMSAEPQVLFDDEEPQGLFDPRQERDACGVGFIADLKGRKSHTLITQALDILENLEHRGAVGADPLAGDGAGILVQIPHDFLVEECVIDPEDRDLFWFAETAQEIWDGIVHWHDAAGEPLHSAI